MNIRDLKEYLSKLNEDAEVYISKDENMPAGIFTHSNLKIGNIATNEYGTKNFCIKFKDGCEMEVHFTQRHKINKTDEVLVIIE